MDSKMLFENIKKIITLAQMLKAENIEKTKSNLTKIGEGAFGEVFKYTKNGSNHILKVSFLLDF